MVMLCWVLHIVPYLWLVVMAVLGACAPDDAGGPLGALILWCRQRLPLSTVVSITAINMAEKWADYYFKRDLPSIGRFLSIVLMASLWCLWACIFSVLYPVIRTLALCRHAFLKIVAKGGCADSAINV